MAPEWIGDVVQAVADSVADSTHGWRPVHRVGCLFVVVGLLGLVWTLVAAFGGEPLRPGGWWACGGLTGVGVLGAAGCFWLGSWAGD